MPTCPGGTDRGSPTSGSVRAASPMSRAISATAGCPASSSKEAVRRPLTRLTPFTRATACTKSGLKYTVSLATDDVPEGGAVRT